jgi:hypothetical protein
MKDLNKVEVQDVNGGLDVIRYISGLMDTCFG